MKADFLPQSCWTVSVLKVLCFAAFSSPCPIQPLSAQLAADFSACCWAVCSWCQGIGSVGDTRAFPLLFRAGLLIYQKACPQNMSQAHYQCHWGCWLYKFPYLCTWTWPPARLCLVTTGRKYPHPAAPCEAWGSVCQAVPTLGELKIIQTELERRAATGSSSGKKFLFEACRAGTEGVHQACTCCSSKRSLHNGASDVGHIWRCNCVSWQGLENKKVKYKSGRRSPCQRSDKGGLSETGPDKVSHQTGTKMKKKSSGLEMSCLKGSELRESLFFFFSRKWNTHFYSIHDAVKFTFVHAPSSSFSLTGITANSSSLYSNLIKNKVHIIEWIHAGLFNYCL